MTFLIHQQLENMAKLRPERLAIQFLNETLTWRQLDDAANRLARVLIDEGVVRHDRVGIYMDKGLHTAIALYGIMKAGAAYVPLDPSAPVPRIAGLISDCDIRQLISSPSKKRNLAALARIDSPLRGVIGVSGDGLLPYRCVSWATVEGVPAEAVTGIRIIESDLAYIIYTSGSTGTPKGIMHTHHSGLSFARWAATEYALSYEDRLSNHAPLHFDLSILDYFSAAVVGAATVIVPEEYTKLPASYSQLLEDCKVTVLYTVPFALIQMLLRGSLEQRDLSALRWAIFGGEPLPSAHLRELCRKLPHVRFDNMYGPAEINGCSHFTIDQIDSDDQPVPIGPLASCAESLIVDANNSPVTRGEIGELLVRTPTMMRGYWQREDLNQQVFDVRTNVIGHPEVFYRTGDFVQELKDGIMRFVGRKDRQVKVRGYRIELDEVELALTAQDPVEEAAVYTLAGANGSQAIYAEVTLKDALIPQQDDALEEHRVTIARSLKKSLPWYALPTQIVIIREFPRTVTGKIDRRLLREQAAQILSAERQTAGHADDTEAGKITRDNGTGQQ